MTRKIKPLSTFVLAVSAAFILANCAVIPSSETDLLKASAAGASQTTVTDWVQYGNREKYKGEMQSKRPHGQGEYRWSNGSSYVGEFRFGLRDGQGTWTSSNGTRYVGMFGNDKPQGHGRLEFPDGSVYTGEFNNGYIAGKGKLVTSERVVLDGKFGATESDNWYFQGLMSASGGFPACKNAFTMKGRKNTSWETSFKDVLNSSVKQSGGRYTYYTRSGGQDVRKDFYDSDPGCKLTAGGPSIEKGIAHGNQQFRSNAFWNSIALKPKKYVLAKYEDGSSLSGTTYNTVLHGNFTWTSADGEKTENQVWQDGRLLYSIPVASWAKIVISEATCKTADIPDKTLVLAGACQNGLVHDKNATVALPHTFNKILVGEFSKGKFVKGQVQHFTSGDRMNLAYNGDNGPALFVTNVEKVYTMGSDGPVPLGKTVMAKGSQVVFDGVFTGDLVGIGDGSCLYNGTFERCKIESNGRRIDEVAKAREQVRIEQNRIAAAKRERERKIQGCNGAIDSLNRELEDLMKLANKTKCGEIFDGKASDYRSLIAGDNMYGDGWDYLKPVRQCVSDEKKEVAQQEKYISSAENSVRSECAGIQDGILPQSREYRDSILEGIGKKHEDLTSMASKLASAVDSAKYAEKQQRQAEREASFQEWAGRMRQEYSYDNFQKSLGVGSGGAWDQAASIVQNYNQSVTRKQQDFQSAIRQMAVQSRELDRKNNVPVTPTYSDPYAAARESCQRTNDTWDAANNRCLPKTKITTYNIDLLPATCAGDGPKCMNNPEGNAVPRVRSYAEAYANGKSFAASNGYGNSGAGGAGGPGNASGAGAGTSGGGYGNIGGPSVTVTTQVTEPDQTGNDISGRSGGSESCYLVSTMHMYREGKQPVEPVGHKYSTYEVMGYRPLYCHTGYSRKIQKQFIGILKSSLCAPPSYPSYNAAMRSPLSDHESIETYCYDSSGEAEAHLPPVSTSSGPAKGTPQ